MSKTKMNLFVYLNEFPILKKILLKDDGIGNKKKIFCQLIMKLD